MAGEKQKQKANSVDRPSIPQTILTLPTGAWYRQTSLLVSLAVSTVLSTVLLVIACLFLGSFHLHLFTMAANNFITSPILMIITSALSLLVGIIGAAVVLRKRTQLYMLLAVLSLIMFLLQIIASTFSFLLVENVLTELDKVGVDEQLSLAVSDNSTRAVWDSIQTRYKCCGGRGERGSMTGRYS